MKRLHARTMGWSIPLAISLASSIVLGARQVEETSNVACVKRLQLPIYPPIAQDARLSMSLTTAIVLASDGSAQSISFERISGERADLAKLFFSELERAMRRSQFSSTCGGKTVRLVFEFRMNGNPPDKMMWFGFPNRFEVWEVSPPVNQATRRKRP